MTEQCGSKPAIAPEDRDSIGGNILGESNLGTKDRGDGADKYRLPRQSPAFVNTSPQGEADGAFPAHATICPTAERTQRGGETGIGAGWNVPLTVFY